MTANATLIVNARLVNEGREYDGDLRIADGRIAEIGTGSWPPGCSGWQRRMRRSASQLPLTAPNRATACIAYSEQVGWNRQRGPSNGLIQRL